MVRILFFILLVLALALGFAWLADRPGELSLIWQGQLIEMSLMRAATILISLVAAILIVVWLIRTLWLSPHTVTRYFRARKRDRGYQALSTGLIAAGAGDAVQARKMAARTRGLISADQEPLIHLLEAQTALIEGKYDDARKKFEVMADDPETRELGLRGLYLEAKRLGANEAARQYAERAAEKAPHLSWATLATLDQRSQAGQWDEAIRLLDQSRTANVLDKKEANRKKAVLLTARATGKLEADPKAARDDALAALKLDDRLVPAALAAAKALFREDNLRKGASILEKMWKHDPHPELARLYVRARGGDSAVDRLKRAKRLETLRGNNAVSLATVAEAALEARELALARTKAEAAARLAPSESIFLLIADIEEADTGDEGRIRHWMAQALRSPRDPAWTADGVTSPTWLPVSPVSGRLDAFEWKEPPSPLAGATEEGRVSVDEAIRSLPPVAPEQQVLVREAPVTPRAEESRPVLEAERPIPTPTPITVPERKESAAPPPKSEETVAEEEEAAPFFGRPPDDPGVRDRAVEDGNKASFRLF
ncbi:heme biosynthesis protein HemY [Sinorhizobium fredii]|uniref:Heme biosynthesis protein HemY n=3 Tax=Rhizobium fredii TaxID=380 RepID=A0A2A6M0A1_RHIFR|nr:heme biosynthesis protein HemY [Sinorhizobium fredii]AWM26857.1 HemY protein [Sinorhizobium fredii CCBAU 25509]MCG5474233.1 heme biosynthesis protein HemY [Sinorhizobium fredii]MQW97027.1 heme biosynthesis protein HemY [Sinorhizobium fredii]MQX10340.1 heme biosynthesis protein HemY [Sinorhizobium fredii]PDT48204.1 heme biosynthesis protein HemY [Sinorhizobium fredii]